MKVLSLLQPWATLCVIGAKKIETRSWQTSHRGELLIHASSGRSGALLCAEPPFSCYIQSFHDLPFGAIIGKVVLEDIIRISHPDLYYTDINKLSLEERAFGDYGPGRFAWIFSHPEEFKQPIPIKGALNLWEYNWEE